MKCKEQDLPKIVRVFPPVNTPDFDRLYVEFESEQLAEHVSSFSRFIRKQNCQVSLYVPNYFQPRFQAINHQAKLIRTAPGLMPGDIKTKVKYGSTDFRLLMKPHNGRWTKVKLNQISLPPLQSPSDRSSASPPPGRPKGSPPPTNHSKRGAPSPLDRPSKASRSRSQESESDPGTPHTPNHEEPLSPGTPPYSPSLASLRHNGHR